MDPRQSVRPGEPITLAASQINGLNRLLATSGGFGGPATGEQPTPYTWVLCRSSVTVPRWGVVAITGLEVTPATAKGKSSFESMPLVTGATPSATTTAWGIAVEPIAAGRIGRLAVAGVVQAKMADLSKVGGYQLLWNDATWALIKIVGGAESYTWAWVLNTTTSTVPKFGSLRLDRLVNISSVLESSGAPVWRNMMTNEQAASVSTPVFTGLAPWTHPNYELANAFGTYLTYGIALADIAPNAIGRVAVSGIVAARVKDAATTDPTTDNVRIAGPCITGGSSLAMLEAGWGPHEIVSAKISSSSTGEYPLYMIRVNANPFRVYAKGYSDDIGSGGLSTGGSGPLVVQLGDIGAERDAMYQSIYRIRVRVKAIYGPVKPGKRCLVEPGPGGTFVVLAVEP